jgi:hypothetical protein
VSVPEPSFEHIVAMSDGIGTFEHADHAAARVGEGYCTDDMARLLVAACRERRPDAVVVGLARMAYRFLDGAQGVDGTVRNRRAAGGRWRGRHGVEDCWGRAMWAFGTAMHRAPENWLRQCARSSFDRGLQQRSPWPRAMSFAALGAAEVLADQPRHPDALRLLADCVDVVGGPSDDPGWAWPEARLTYANAVLAEGLVAAGALLERPGVLDDGLVALRWLMARETVDGHLSPTGTGGAGPGDLPPMFDQQPIEAATMADACARAYGATGEPAWHEGLKLAIGWFLGANDVGLPVADLGRGAGYDGLEANGVNLNQGTESTLALITTLQHARAMAPSR